MNPRKIMVVDDEQNIRELISEFLTELGYNVSMAVDGIDALEKIHFQQYDLYIIDVYMPRMGGLDMISKLKEMQPLAVIIVTTGFSSIDVAIRAIRTGAYHYLTKPIQADELIKVVESGLAHAAELAAASTVDSSLTLDGGTTSELLLLRGFSATQTRDFLALGTLVSYHKDDDIPLSEEPGSMIFVDSGAINVYYNSALVESLKEGDIWGEEIFMHTNSVFTTCIAQGEVRVRHFKRKKIMEYFTYNDETLTKRYMINLIQCLYMKWRRSCFRIGLYSGFNTEAPKG